MGSLPSREVIQIFDSRVGGTRSEGVISETTNATWRPSGEILTSLAIRWLTRSQGITGRGPLSADGVDWARGVVESPRARKGFKALAMGTDPVAKKPRRFMFQLPEKIRMSGNPALRSFTIVESVLLAQIIGGNDRFLVAFR